MITGPSGVGKGTLIRGLLRAHPRARAVGVGDHARAAPGRGGRRRLPLPRPTQSSSAASRDGRLRRARRATRAAATGRCAPSSSGGWPAGAPVVLEIEVQGARQVREAMPEAVQVFIAPPSLRGAARAAGRPRHRRRRAGRARGCRRAEQELAAQRRVRARGRQRPPRGRRRRARRDRARAALRRRQPARVTAEPTSPDGRTRPLDLTPHRQAARARRLRLRERDRRRQARAPDQLLLPQPRRGDVRRVPAADGRDALEELPDDRARRGRQGKLKYHYR